jgi:hypothetical protein
MWPLKNKASKAKIVALEQAVEKERQEYLRLCEQARDLIEKTSYRNFTTLEIYNPESREYLEALKDIFDTKQFLFFIDLHKQYCLREIMDGNKDAGTEMQGVLKGIDYIMKNLYSAKQKYLQLKESENIENETQI